MRNIAIPLIALGTCLFEAFNQLVKCFELDNYYTHQENVLLILLIIFPAIWNIQHLGKNLTKGFLQLNLSVWLSNLFLFSFITWIQKLCLGSDLLYFVFVYSVLVSVWTDRFRYMSDLQHVELDITQHIWLAHTLSQSNSWNCFFDSVKTYQRQHTQQRVEIPNCTLISFYSPLIASFCLLLLAAPCPSACGSVGAASLGGIYPLN